HAGRERDRVLARQPDRRRRARRRFRRRLSRCTGRERGELYRLACPNLTITMRKLLRPGLHVKRWLGVLLVGMVVLSLGIGYAATELYRTVDVPGWVGIITLQFLPLIVRAILFLAVGTGLCVYGVFGLYRSLNAVLPSNQSLLERIYEYRIRQG